MQLGLSSILTIIFVIAKLAGVISWSWFWVFSPVIAALAFVGGVSVLAVVVAVATK